MTFMNRFTIAASSHRMGRCFDVHNVSQRNGLVKRLWNLEAIGIADVSM
jgi:hypothetical protein